MYSLFANIHPNSTTPTHTAKTYFTEAFRKKKYRKPKSTLIGNEQVVAKYGGIRGIPTTFVIDRKGQIVEKAVGYRDKAFFESIIKKHL